MAPLLIAEADAPALVQGETEERPIPVPRAKRIRDSAAVTNAPAITAAQDTPEVYASFFTWGSGKAVRWSDIEIRLGSIKSLPPALFDPFCFFSILRIKGVS